MNAPVVITIPAGPAVLERSRGSSTRSPAALRLNGAEDLERLDERELERQAERAARLALFEAGFAADAVA